MRFPNHFREQTPRPLKTLLTKFDNNEHKTALWNAFVDSELSAITEDDCSILPRVLPASYLPVVRRTALEITTFVLRLLSLPEREVRAIVPSGPVRDFLVNELEVLKHRPNRMTGSFRFDMAIAGLPEVGNPPKLLEINEIGFDGLARSSFIQKTLLELIPGLKGRVLALDTAQAEVKNMLRLGRKISRFQYDCYNWDEEFLLRTGKRLGAEISLVSPKQFRCKIDNDFPLLEKEPVSIQKGRVKVGQHFPDAVQMSFAFGLDDYKKGRDLYRSLVRSKTPQYAPFITGLVASKMVLVLMSDLELRRKLLGSSKKLAGAILPAFPLEGNIEEARARSNELVLKHTDGWGGEQVFMGPEFMKNLKSIKPKEIPHWVVQERTRLNILKVQGIRSRHREVISDLGVFVQYDWANGKFRHFEVGGFITRATNRSFKVNVSGGGIQVPVMFLRGE